MTPQIDSKTLVADYPGGTKKVEFAFTPVNFQKVRGVVTVIYG